VFLALYLDLGRVSGKDSQLVQVFECFESKFRQSVHAFCSYSWAHEHIVPDSSLSFCSIGNLRWNPLNSIKTIKELWTYGLFWFKLWWILYYYKFDERLEYCKLLCIDLYLNLLNVVDSIGHIRLQNLRGVLNRAKKGANWIQSVHFWHFWQLPKTTKNYNDLFR